MTQSENPIEKIRARLDGGNKWVKGTLSNESGYCMIGAAKAEGVRLYGDVIGEVIVEQYADRVSPFYRDVVRLHPSVGIPGFNDHEDTVWSDVELVLDKASLRWEESRAAR